MSQTSANLWDTIQVTAERQEATIVLGRADGWWTTCAYGLAHLGKSLFWYASEILFAFYLTELVGLSTAGMGVVLATGLLVSAGIDIVVGFSFRRSLTDARLAGRLQLLGAILCALAFPAVFLGFWIEEEFRFSYAIAAGLGFRLAYALYDIPQNALMALGTQDRSARDRVASTRIWFSGLATLLIAVAVGPLIAAGDQEDAAVRYMILAACVAAPAIIGAAALSRIVGRSAQTGLPPITIGGAHTQRPNVRAIFTLMLALMFVTSLATPLFAKLEPYFASFVLRSPFWGGTIIVAMAVGITLGQPLWALLCRRTSHARVMSIAAVVQIVALAIFGGIPGLPPEGLTICAFGFGLGNGGVGMVLWASFADAVARSAVGREGEAYALFTATAKLALGFGGLGLGMILSSFDFRGAESGALVLWMTALPAAGALLCLVIGFAWSRQLR